MDNSPRSDAPAAPPKVWGFPGTPGAPRLLGYCDGGLHGRAAQLACDLPPYEDADAELAPIPRAALRNRRVLVEKPNIIADIITQNPDGSRPTKTQLAQWDVYTVGKGHSLIMPGNTLKMEENVTTGRVKSFYADWFYGTGRWLGEGPQARYGTYHLPVFRNALLGPRQDRHMKPADYTPSMEQDEYVHTSSEAAQAGARLALSLFFRDVSINARDDEEAAARARATQRNVGDVILGITSPSYQFRAAEAGAKTGSVWRLHNAKFGIRHLERSEDLPAAGLDRRPR
jgi:hypothetical protein